MHQGRVEFIVTTAPHRPAPKPDYLRLTYSGPTIALTNAERLGDIRRRCPALTDSDIAFLTRTAPRGQASRRRRRVP